MSYEEKYTVSKRGKAAGNFTALEIIDLLRMKELSGIHKVKVDNEELTVATFVEAHNSGGLPEQNMAKSVSEVEKKEEKEEEEVQPEPPPPDATSKS